MTFTILTILFLVLAGVLWIVFRIRFSSRQKSLAQLETSLTPVDAAALANLLHGREDNFLRQNLGPREYRLIKRERVRAAQQYVWKVFRNASVLSRIAGLALDSADPEIRAIALKLANDAVELRRYAVLTLLFLVAQLVYPEFQTDTFKLRERYTSLAESASWFYRLRFPESRIRIGAALCG